MKKNQKLLLKYIKTMDLNEKPHRNIDIRFIIGVLVVVLIISSVFFIKNSGDNNKFASQDTRIDAPKEKAKQTINKDFDFSIKDNSGKEIAKLKYTIESAQIQDEIFIKGELAKAIKGRTFLIFNLKIANENNQGIQINTRNYIRLSTNNKDWFAPDIHNDPVEVQAISTKLTRLGFPIGDTDKSLFLKIGEINGEKESIKLNLRPL